MYLYMHVLMQADETIHAIFPMRFRDDTDLAIATSFFQVRVPARIASIVRCSLLQRSRGRGRHGGG